MSAHFLRNTRAQLEVNASVGAADGAVTATVRGEDGTTLATGAATHSVVIGTPGLYSFACPPQAELNRITATWAGTWGGFAQSLLTSAEVVGGLLFTVAEARAYKDQQLADTNLYTDEAIRECRDRIEDDFQNCCGVPFFPRFERDTFDGTGRTRLWLPYKRPLRLSAVSTSGVAMTAGELAAVVLYPTGRLETTGALWASGQRNITIAWERGYQQVPEEIKRAALALAHYELTASDITDRMVTVANELGTVRLSVPGRNAPTGIPLIDAVLNRFDERDVLVAMR